MGAVLELISKNELRVNDKLPTEKEISEMLGVSRNGVREVMKTLNIAGMTRSIAGKGTFMLVDSSEINCTAETLMDSVAGSSLFELIEVRRIIETETAALAAICTTVWRKYK